MKRFINIALDMGFTSAALISAADVISEDRIRKLCDPEKCPSYGTNWVCPPGCGTLEKCRSTVETYDEGLLIQMKFENVDTSSLTLAERLSKEFSERVVLLRERIAEEYPMTLALASGGCRECEKCTYPEEPCRKPNVHRGSLSAFGIGFSVFSDFNIVADKLLYQKSRAKR